MRTRRLAVLVLALAMPLPLLAGEATSCASMHMVPSSMLSMDHGMAVSAVTESKDLSNADCASHSSAPATVPSSCGSMSSCASISALPISGGQMAFAPAVYEVVSGVAVPPAVTPRSLEPPPPRA